VGGDGIAGQSGPSTWITYGRRKQRNGRTAGASTQGRGRLQQLNPSLRVSSLKDVLGPYRRAEDLLRYELGCDKPGCPTDHRRQVLARGDEMIEQERRLPPLAPTGHADCIARCPLSGYVNSGYAQWGGLPGNVLLAFEVRNP
jgi:hypothetical protein